jgi:hypothetical protein
MSRKSVQRPPLLCVVCEKRMKRTRHNGNKLYCGKRCTKRAAELRATAQLQASGHIEKRLPVPMF